MPSLMVIGQQIKETRRGGSLYYNKIPPGLNRLRQILDQFRNPRADLL